MQALDSPIVQKVLHVLQHGKVPMSARMLATKAAGQPLAYALADELFWMRAPADKNELHNVLVAAYPSLLGKPSLEDLWVACMTERSSSRERTATRGVLEALQRALIGDDGTFKLAAVEPLCKTLSIELPGIMLELLEEVVGTPAQPALHVKKLKMTPTQIRDYGCLWVFVGCHLLRLDDPTAAVEAFKQAVLQRRFAGRTNLIAGRAFRLALETRKEDKTLVKHAEAFLLPGEREARTSPKEHPRFIQELVNLYRLVGTPDQLDAWARQLHETPRPFAAAKGPAPVPAVVRHRFADMVSYPDFLDDDPIVVPGGLRGKTGTLIDFHCPDPKCVCGVVFVRIQAEDEACHGVFEVRLRYESPSTVAVVEEEPHCEHVSDIITFIQKCIASPNEIQFLRQRAEGVKTLLRTQPKEFQRKAEEAREKAQQVLTETPELRWIPFGKSVTSSAFKIAGGVYVVDSSSRTEEPSAINHSLLAEKGPLPAPQARVHYGYAHKVFRHDYLQWLAAGRPTGKNPQFLELFLYGLERRYLQAPVSPDLSVLLPEVEKLADLAGNRDLSRQLRAFHLYLSLRAGQVDIDALSLSGENDPLALQKACLVLGMQARRKEPLSSDWVLVWYRETRLKPENLSEEILQAFSALWPSEFAKAFPEGLRVDDGRGRFVATYPRLNPSLPTSLYRFETNALDLSRSSLTTHLEKLATHCLSCLKSFERAREQAPAYPAYAHLPGNALAGMSNETLARFEKELESLLNGQPHAILPVSTWISLFEGGDVRGWHRLLRARGYDMEPDPASGAAATAPGGDDKIVLFRLPAPEAEAYAPTGGMWSALILLRLGLIIVSELGLDVPRTSARVITEGKKLGRLSPADVARLKALSGLHVTSPSLARPLRGIENVHAAQREGIGQALVNVLHDRMDDPQVVKRLEKAFALLGLEPQSLFTALHAAVTGSVRTAGKTDLDLKLIKSRLSETRTVDSMLESIFVEEEVVAGPVAEGLPPTLRSFLERLAQEDRWSRTSVVEVAGSLGLLADGAIDSINDLSLERYDELALEGDDPIYVNRDVMDQLLSWCRIQAKPGKKA